MNVRIEVDTKYNTRDNPKSDEFETDWEDSIPNILFIPNFNKNKAFRTHFMPVNDLLMGICRNFLCRDMKC